MNLSSHDSWGLDLDCAVLYFDFDVRGGVCAILLFSLLKHFIMLLHVITWQIDQITLWGF